MVSARLAKVGGGEETIFSSSSDCALVCWGRGTEGRGGPGATGTTEADSWPPLMSLCCSNIFLRACSHLCKVCNGTLSQGQEWYGEEARTKEWYGEEARTKEWYGEEARTKEWYGEEARTKEWYGEEARTKSGLERRQEQRVVWKKGKTEWYGEEGKDKEWYGEVKEQGGGGVEGA